MAARFDRPGKPFYGLTRKTSSGRDWSGKVRFIEDHLLDPLRRETPTMFFVNSVSDLFHEELAVDAIVSVARVMEACPWHTFQVLTKRANRMARLLNNELRFVASLQHILWGVSVENRKALSRLDELRSTPRGLRFVSFEPLLEDLGKVNLRGIDWVIVGGESGQKARPFRKEWVENLRDQASDAGIPFFFKQWGGRRKKEAGCLLDGLEYKQYPRTVLAAMPTRRERESIRARFDTV
jgi:protein gp37